VAEEEEGSSEGVSGGWMKRRGRFGWQADPCFDFPRSRGILGTVGEQKCASNRAGEDKSREGKGWVGGGALQPTKRASKSWLWVWDMMAREHKKWQVGPHRKWVMGEVYHND
jgi:hypothetical protein